MGKDTVYRVEERKHPHKGPLDFINQVFNPTEKDEQEASVDSNYKNKGIVLEDT